MRSKTSPESSHLRWNSIDSTIFFLLLRNSLYFYKIFSSIRSFLATIQEFKIDYKIWWFKIVLNRVLQSKVIFCDFSHLEDWFCILEDGFLDFDDSWRREEVSSWWSSSKSVSALQLLDEMSTTNLILVCMDKSQIWKDCRSLNAYNQHSDLINQNLDYLQSLFYKYYGDRLILLHQINLVSIWWVLFE